MLSVWRRSGVVAAIGLAVVLVAVACAKAEPTATPTATPTPRPAATPTATPTPRPAATPTATPIPAPAATATPTPRRGIRLAENATAWADINGKFGGTLRVAVNQLSATYDLVQNNSHSGMTGALGPRVEGIVRLHENDPGVVVPDLAKSWQISADGKTYTFNLRDGVKWHDGQPFTSADVVAHFTRVWKPAEGIFSPRKGWFEAVNAIEAPDRLTVQFKLDFPFSPLLSYLANGQAGAIMAKHILDKNKQDLRKVVDFPGTGPFKFKNFVQDQLWEYERNKEYWNGDLPYLDKVEVYVWATAGESVAPLLAGRVDFQRLADRNAWLRTDGDARWIRAKTAAGFTWYLFMNPAKPPFNDIRVRQAMNLLMDRAAMKATIEVYQPKADLGDMWVPFGSGFEKDIAGDTWKNRLPLKTDAESRKQAIAQAKELLTQAGWKNGQEFRVIFRLPGGPFFTFQGEMLEAALNKNIGPVKFNYIGQDRVLTNQSLLKGDYDIGLELYNISEIDHPVQWLAETWRKDGAQAYSNNNNPQFNDLASQLKRAQSQADLIRLSRQMLEILYTDVPAISTPWPGTGCVYGAFVKNMFCGNTAPGYFSNYMRYDTIWLDK